MPILSLWAVCNPFPCLGSNRRASCHNGRRAPVLCHLLMMVVACASTRASEVASGNIVTALLYLTKYTPGSHKFQSIFDIQYIIIDPVRLESITVLFCFYTQDSAIK